MLDASILENDFFLKLISAFTGIAAVSIPYLMKWSLNQIRISHPFNKIWGFKNNGSVFLINGIVETKSKYLKGNFILGPGDVKALVGIARSLEKRYNVLEIKNLYSKQVTSQDMINENIVSIGGPKRNKVTRELMKSFGCRYNINKGVLIDEWTNRDPLSPKKAESGDYYAKDYGIILKEKISSEPEKWGFVIAGCHTEGTMGAAKFLMSLNKSDEKRIRELAKEFGKNPFQIAVETEILKDEMGVIEVRNVKKILDEPVIISCSKCGTLLSPINSDTCPECGSEDKKITLIIKERIRIRDSFNWEIKREFFKTKPKRMGFIILIALGLPFLGIFLSRFTGFVIGSIFGILSFLFGPYIIIKVREIEREIS